MSYPVLRITGDYAWVEVRRGRGAVRWRDMEPIHQGPAANGQEWKGGEGDKLWGKHCLWPTDPDSTLSQPYDISSREGLSVGKPRVLEFPSRVGRFSSLSDADIETATAAQSALPRLTLHEDPRSGNCYKIKLTAALLGIPLELRQYDIMQGETRTPAFLDGVNANGRIPVLEIDEGEQTRFLPESNAACWYLASGSDLIPQDRFEQADVLRWMFFEQYNHEPNVATMRFWMQFVGEDNLTGEQRGQIAGKRANGEAALRLMDEHLATNDFMLGAEPSLADIVLFAYSHVADEGSFGLENFGNLARWIARIQALPKFVPMD